MRNILAVTCVAYLAGCADKESPSILVFSRTAAFRHDSIPDGIRVLQDLGSSNGFAVVATEQPETFTDAELRKYAAVVFLNTTGDVLDETQQAAFERYIRAGGGFVGVHAAADTEYGWGFYVQLVGATFRQHDAVQPGTLTVNDLNHPAAEKLPNPWRVTDEWYELRASPRGKVNVLLSLDETTVRGGTMGAEHPIAWYRELEGGRSFYTARGHTRESYAEPAFRDHLVGGIRWAAGLEDATPATPLPDAGGLKTTVLDSAVDRGMELAVAADGRVFFIERGGKVRVWRPDTQRSSDAAALPVDTGHEDGLLGLTLDPQFAANGWLYLFYSAVGAPEQRVARFTVSGDRLDLASERVLLRIPVERVCCHSAGSLAFSPDGLLYISVGDNTDPFSSDGFAPIDERPGNETADAQRSAANTNDLRGKILRIRPEAGGTYTIPNGNLFPRDGAAGRPEIYVMGCRNPFRFGIHPTNGWLYWGDIGPDAQNDSPGRGPAGHDELNVATTAGNFGWPYFTADNQAYRPYNFASGRSEPPLAADVPLNLSPNNTGARVLPPARPAAIFYPYNFSPAFSALGSGMRSLLAGPVYRRPSGAPRALPARYDGAVLAYELMRGHLFDVRFDASGGLASLTRFPDLGLHLPIDVEMGGDGALYVLEYGPDDYFFPGRGRLMRIEGAP